MEDTRIESDILPQQTSLTMVGLSKSGYLEIKQPSNVKGRKLKTWKRKWIVVHKMTDLAAGTFAAKFILYGNDVDAKQNSSERQTFIFDHVTSVEGAKSKTRPLAFQIVENSPALMLSGSSTEETDDWIKSLKELFWPKENVDEDTFQVSIEENEDSKIWSLKGNYWLSVSPEIITIKSFEDNSILEWNLNFIKRFFMDKTDVNILIIETGSISEFGEAQFRFQSQMVPEILAVIKRNIQDAIKMQTIRKRNSDSGSCSIVQGNTSITKTNKSFQTLLCRSSSDDNSVMNVSTVPDASTIEANYSSLETPTRRGQETKIVSKVLVNREVGNNVEVMFDHLGYSHIDLDVKQNELDSTQKSRSVSNCMEDGDFPRSTSVCSNDSGIVQCVNEHVSEGDIINRTTKHKSNNSFDSGISIRPEINASIAGIFVMSENDITSSNTLSLNSSTIVESKKSKPRRKISGTGNYASIYWDVGSQETINYKLESMIEMENQYEDLDKYRKNLSKHLGFDPRINPTEIPPSLPDRPSTLPTRRKERSKSVKKKDKKMPKIQDMLKTVTRGRAESISSTSSSISEGDDEKLNTPTLKNRKEWPLANSALSGTNELYTSVPNEGVFQSIRPRARSYEDKPTKDRNVLENSIVSVRDWPMALSSAKVNNVPVYEPTYSKTCKGTRRSLRRSNSAVDLSKHDENRLDLLTGGDLNDDLAAHTNILHPVSLAPESVDFIDFSTEINVPELGNITENKSISEEVENINVWNPFPKIADFTNIIKTEFEEEEEEETKTYEVNSTDPFDIFHIGVISSSLGLCTNKETTDCNAPENRDLERTIYDPKEEIYMDMGNPQHNVEYVLPSELSRTKTS